MVALVNDSNELSLLLDGQNERVAHPTQIGYGVKCGVPFSQSALTLRLVSSSGTLSIWEEVDQSSAFATRYAKWTIPGARVYM